MKLLIDIILLAVIIGFMMVGFKKGFVKMLISFVKNIVAFFIAFKFSGVLGAWLKKQFFMEKAREFIENKVAEFLGAETAAGADVTPLLNAEHSEFLSFIDKMGVDIDALSAAFEKSGGEINRAISEYIAEPCVSAVSNVVAFILLFVGALIVISVISLILSLVVKLPVIKTTNRFLGGVLGLVLGIFSAFVITALIRAVLPYFSDTVVVASLEQGTTLYNLISSFSPAFLLTLLVK